MSKKQVICLGLAIVLLSIVLPGCSNGKKSLYTKKDKYVVGFSQIGTESEWRIANTNEMIEAYEQNPRFTLLYSDAEQKRENQITAIRGFIKQKVDAIILVPIVATGWDAILTEVKEAKIPVILINRGARMVSGNIEDFTVCLVAPDNVYAGELLARTFIDSFGDKPGPISVVEITGTIGSSSTVDRGRGIHNVIDSDNRVSIRYSQTGDFNRATARHVSDSIIRTARAEGVVLEGLIAQSDDMALGAMQSFIDAGIQPGRDIKIVGIDGIRDAFVAMSEGLYYASVENPLGYGEATIKILLDLLDNSKKPDDYWVVLKNEVYLQKDAASALPNRKY